MFPHLWKLNLIKIILRSYTEHSDSHSKNDFNFNRLWVLTLSLWTIVDNGSTGSPFIWISSFIKSLSLYLPPTFIQSRVICFWLLGKFHIERYAIHNYPSSLATRPYTKNTNWLNKYLQNQYVGYYFKIANCPEKRCRYNKDD